MIFSRKGIFTTLGFLLFAVSFYLFIQGQESYPLAWRLYCGFLVSFLIATCSEPGLVRSLLPSKSEWLYLALILAIGTGLRIYLLDSYPYGIWFDEAQNILVAKNIITDPTYRPIFIPDATQLPAFPFYYYSFFISLFGIDIFSLRLAITVIGVLSIVATWALAKELFGWRIALLSAAFFAILRWHINFSRFGMTNIFVTLFAPLAILFFVRSQRRNSTGDALLSGVCLGLGLQTYYAMLGLPAIFILIFLHRFIARQVVSLKTAILSVLVFLCVYSPVMWFASQNWQLFSKRLSMAGSVSPGKLINDIIKNPSEYKTVLAPLKEPFLRHARMFHIHGDSNGRHNLPSHPMLDRVMGVLFLLGGAWTLICCLFDWRFSLLVAYFALNISAGIFSLDFEAPQAARALGLTTAVAILCAIPFQLFLSEKRRGFINSMGVVLFLISFAGAAYLNAKTYFIDQRYDYSTWASFSTPETFIGHLTKKESSHADIYVPESWNGGPTETIILGKEPNNFAFMHSRDLPFPDNGRDVIVVVWEQDPRSFEAVMKVYPKAHVEDFRNPTQGDTQGTLLLRAVTISNELIKELSSWDVTIQKGGQQILSAKTNHPVVNWNSSNSEPPFVGTIKGNLRLPVNITAEFSLESASPTTVMIDGEVVLDSVSPVKTMTLAQGSHIVEIQSCVTSSDPNQITKLLYRPQGSTEKSMLPAKDMYAASTAQGGLTGHYINGLDLNGLPYFLRNDPTVEFYFHLLPLPRPFSIIWKGSLSIPVEGTYQIGVSSIDNTDVFIDDEKITTSKGAQITSYGTRSFTKGLHKIELKYQSKTDFAQVYLRWIRPGEKEEIIPATFLHPLSPTGQVILEQKTFPSCR